VATRVTADDEAGAAPVDVPVDRSGEVECVVVGMEASCFLSEDEEGEPGGLAAAEEESGGAGGLLGVLGGVALVSPFFLWGTSMVAMKVGSGGQCSPSHPTHFEPSFLSKNWHPMTRRALFIRSYMKEVLPATSPLFVASIRLVPAGAVLIAWAASRGRPWPKGGKAWLAIALFALVDGTVFQGCLSQGLQRTSAGLGSVIIDSQPLTVAVLASVLYGERLAPTGIFGLFLGVAGRGGTLLLSSLQPEPLLSLDKLTPPSVSHKKRVTLTRKVDEYKPLVAGLLLLELPQDAVVQLAGGDMPQAFALVTTGVSTEGGLWESGEWWMLLAAQSMAVGTVMVRWVCKYVDPVMATGWHMALGGVPLLAYSLSTEPEVYGNLGNLGGAEIGGLLYTSLLGSALAYGAFFYFASKGSLTKLSSLTFLTPMFAALFGYLLLGERLDELQLAGAALTVLAIYLVSTGASEPADLTE